MAQPSPGAWVPPQNVLQLSANGTVEVAQDLLSITLVATKEGTDPAAVQAQVKQVMDAALAEARKSAQPGQLDVRTGNFNVHPRYTREGKTNGWQGTAELVLEGRDFARVSQVAGRLDSLTVGNMSYGLSREARAKAESEAQTLAIGAFKQKASALAKDFGFVGYGLREVSVNADHAGPMPRVMAMKASAPGADAAVPVEPGKASVVVNVSGSVQLK
ncbi:MAG: SIMPL domain-containing protein [Proteobacteria bacterium]|nr:SIMPL domain-containing protein [Pseudomonadota bacterium]